MEHDGLDDVLKQTTTFMAKESAWLCLLLLNIHLHHMHITLYVLIVVGGGAPVHEINACYTSIYCKRDASPAFAQAPRTDRRCCKGEAAIVLAAAVSAHLRARLKP
jgi:hypothetical protein